MDAAWPAGAIMRERLRFGFFARLAGTAGTVDVAARFALSTWCIIVFLVLHRHFSSLIQSSPMPIYEYRCDSCGFQKEFLQRMSDARLTDCPECKKPTLSKMVTAAGFQLKGSGWYATDFRSGGSNTAEARKKAESKQTDTTAKAEGGQAESGAAAAAKTETSKAESASAASSTPSAPAAPAAASGSSASTPSSAPASTSGS